VQVELKPLMDQLSRVKDLDAPDYGTLQAWELRASAAARASNADPGANDSSRPGQAGTPMPFLGETKVPTFTFVFCAEFFWFVFAMFRNLDCLLAQKSCWMVGQSQTWL